MKKLEVYTSMLNKAQIQVLEKAQLIYGTKKQLAVAAEECCELSQALLKLFRYDNVGEGIVNTREKVLEERADVEVVLHYIDASYTFSTEEISKIVSQKISRLQSGLGCSNKSEYREIPIKDYTCEGCFYYDHFDDPDRENACKHCPKSEEYK